MTNNVENYWCQIFKTILHILDTAAFVLPELNEECISSLLEPHISYFLFIFYFHFLFSIQFPYLQQFSKHICSDHDLHDRKDSALRIQHSDFKRNIMFCYFLLPPLEYKDLYYVPPPAAHGGLR